MSLEQWSLVSQLRNVLYIQVWYTKGSILDLFRQYIMKINIGLLWNWTYLDLCLYANQIMIVLYCLIWDFIMVGLIIMKYMHRPYIVLYLLQLSMLTIQYLNLHVFPNKWLLDIYNVLHRPYSLLIKQWMQFVEIFSLLNA